MREPLMRLCCQHCRWRPPLDITQGVMAAHFETEHDTEDIRLELIAICTRDDSELSLTHTEPGPVYDTHTYDCLQCFRTYGIRQGHQPTTS